MFPIGPVTEKEYLSWSIVRNKSKRQLDWGTDLIALIGSSRKKV